MNLEKIIFLGFEYIWIVSGSFCLVLGILLIVNPKLQTSLENRLSPSRVRYPRWPVAVLGVVFPSLMALYKWAQFESYQLMQDSGILINAIWNFTHGYGYVSSPWANKPVWAGHFSCFQAFVMGPLLRIWPSALSLAVAQGFVFGLSLLGVYLLARLWLASPLAQWVLVLLVMSQRFFHDLTGAIVTDSVYAVPIIIWGVYCWECGYTIAATVLGALLLMTREQVPFLYFGLGLYFFLRAKAPRRGWGSAIMVGSVLSWFIEMKIILSNQGDWAARSWSSFDAVGGSTGAIAYNVLHRPWVFLAALVYPPVKLWIVAKTFLSMALLPLGAGAALFPALMAWVPHQLAAARSHYNTMGSHDCAFVFGALVIAAGKGLQVAFKKVPASRRHVFLSCLFTVVGLLFVMNSDFYLSPSAFPASWRESGPKALALIPDNAKVWGDEYFLPHLALRHYVKILPRRLPNDFFESGLFLPDRVLLSKSWMRICDPVSRERIMAFLVKNNFRIVLEESDLVVLAYFPPSVDSGDSVRWVAIPS